MKINWEDLQGKSFYQATARERAYGMVDKDTFKEFLGPRDKMTSPHLLILGKQLNSTMGLL